MADSGRPAAQNWLTLGAASELLGVSESTIRRWADAGDVGSYRTRGGHRRILEEDLRQLVSAQAGYDGAYGSYGRSNPKFASIASYVGNRFTDYTRDLYRGPDAEFLDAFVFGRFDLGEVPLTVKLGRHSLYWGESLFVNGNLNSIAYAQNPLDLQKGFATPGAEAKELFRPLNQISAQAALTDELTVMGQYFLEWDSFRFPEGGTFLGPVDFAFRGPQRQYLGRAPNGAPVWATNGGNINPDERGDFGLGARWSPQWLDGTLGVYWRSFADKMPQTFITQAPPLGPTRYNLIYADQVKLLGVSLAKSIAGVSVGAEISTRRNTPLTSRVLGVAIDSDTAGVRRYMAQQRFGFEQAPAGKLQNRLKVNL